MFIQISINVVTVVFCVGLNFFLIVTVSLALHVSPKRVCDFVSVPPRPMTHSVNMCYPIGRVSSPVIIINYYRPTLFIVLFISATVSYVQLDQAVRAMQEDDKTLTNPLPRIKKVVENVADVSIYIPSVPI
jgi:hypothetical protein